MLLLKFYLQILSQGFLVPQNIESFCFNGCADLHQILSHYENRGYPIEKITQKHSRYGGALQALMSFHEDEARAEWLLRQETVVLLRCLYILCQDDHFLQEYLRRPNDFFFYQERRWLPSIRAILRERMWVSGRGVY